MVRAFSFRKRETSERENYNSRKNYNWKSYRFQNKKAQFKIQQMAFMIIAVFFFFVLVGLFFLNWQFGGVKQSYAELQKEQAISSLVVITDMPELNCDSRKSLCLDMDKLDVMSAAGAEWEEMWPVKSVKVYKVYPKFESIVECPGLDCNYYEIYDSGQTNVKEYATYVSMCKKISHIYDKCEISKLVVGVKILENEG